jgi:hypothetical protein
VIDQKSLQALESALGRILFSKPIEFSEVRLEK